MDAYCSGHFCGSYTTPGDLLTKRARPTCLPSDKLGIDARGYLDRVNQLPNGNFTDFCIFPKSGFGDHTISTDAH